MKRWHWKLQEVQVGWLEAVGWPLGVEDELHEVDVGRAIDVTSSGVRGSFIRHLQSPFQSKYACQKFRQDCSPMGLIKV